MVKMLLNFIGLSLGGWVGWWLGAHIGMMTAYIVSLCGSAVGFYLARRIAKDLP